MGEISLLRKPSLTKVQQEIKIGTVEGTVIAMVEDVDLVEGVSGAVSLGISHGSVLKKGAEEEAGMEEGMIDMEAVGEVEGMVLTEMGIDLVVGTGRQGIVEAQEVTGIAGTALGLMSVGPQEVTVEDK